MTDQERDDFPMLRDHVELPRRTMRSASLSVPSNTYYDSEDTFVAHTGPIPMHSYTRRENDPFYTIGNHRNKPHAITPEEYNPKDFPYNKHSTKNEHLMMSGALGVCNNPDCTDCPAYGTKKRYPRDSALFGSKFQNISYRKSGGWVMKILNKYFPIMNPHTKVIQNWNKFFVISCLVAIFIDPLFFFVLTVHEKSKCISFDWNLAIIIAVVRSVTDFIYLFHMLLQFRLAYVAPESRVVGAGDLVDQPRKIALNYLKCRFWIDLFVVFPLPQVLILGIIPRYVGVSAANYAKNLLRLAILIQYIPRILRFLPLVAGHSTNGFIFESAWANFVINLLMFVLAGHVVGACWYLFGLQRVNQCLRDACYSTLTEEVCGKFLDCGPNRTVDSQWSNDSYSTDCLNSSGHFSYGIYEQAVLLTTERSFVKRYIYALFWGFQQISTLAGNLVPSYFVWEVLFTMAIIGLGLLLFALLIGNMQNFLLALGRRKLEMQLRRRDVERWMSHRRLPVELRRKVRQAERVSWVATQGVNEEELMENLPEDLQREIRRHFFKFLNKVRLFTLMDEPTLDAVCEKLRQKFYIKGSDILYYGGPLEKMIFIVRGKVESIGVDGNKDLLAEGDVCGEELLTWFLEQTSVNRERPKVRFPGQRLYSTRTVKCLSNVEAFALRASDLEDMTTLFLRFLRSPRVQGAIRYESPYWRTRAATLIQVAWRYRQKRLKRAETSNNRSTDSTSHRLQFASSSNSNSVGSHQQAYHLSSTIFHGWR